MDLHKLVATETWAIDPEWLTRAVLAGPLTPTGRLPKVDGVVAILPMHGMISQRASVWQDVFGGTSTQAFGAAYARAVNDDRIKAIVFDVDSPGGTTAGVEELAELIRDGSERKTTVAVANSLMASAAYWLSSQVGEKRLFAAPGSEVGSVGVFRMHEDLSEAMAQAGVKVNFIAVPEYKTEANPYEPLSVEARDHHLSQVQATYERFVRHVARGRNASSGLVKADYGKGRTFHAEQAAEIGMVDGVKTLTQVLLSLGAGGKATVQSAESLDMEQELCAVWENGSLQALTPITDIEIRKRRLALATKFA